jgi:tetratricopeptide (TPR) repeat protein
LIDKTELLFFFKDTNENRLCVEKYEANRVYIEGIIDHGTIQDLEDWLPVKLMQYADPLNKSGRYSEALIAVSQVEDSLQKLKENSDYYTGLVSFATFLKAICYGRQKKYSKSNHLLKELMKKEPMNEVYEDWYRANLKDTFSRILTPITILGVSCMALAMAGHLTGLTEQYQMVIDGGLIIALVAFVLNTLLRFIISKIPLKKNN